MSSNVIYPQGGGGVEITIPAGESIAVFTKDVAQVYRKLGYPDIPDTLSLLGTVNNQQTVFGAYASGATIVIEAGAAEVLYQVGSAPVVLEEYDRQLQGAPTAETGAATLTIAELLTGIVTMTQSTGGNVNLTLPTGTLTDAGLEMAIGESFDWSVINLSAAAADTVTVAAGTGHTVVGVMVVQSAHATTGGLYGNAARLRTRKTAANTFVTYRIG
jgi:hypothetical protein